MSLRNRALLALFAIVCASAIGCSGRSGGSGGGPPATAAPSATPSAGSATPTAVPTATPTAAPTASPYATPAPVALPATPGPLPLASALAVPSRPLANGDAFAFSGRTVESLVYRNSVPPPTLTTTSSVTQSGTVAAPASYAGQGAAYDLLTTETDTSSVQIVTKTDAYYLLSALSGGSDALLDLGYASTDTTGRTLTVTTGGGNGLVDVLPEVTGTLSPANTAAQSIAETDADGFSSSRTIAADGSYVENDLYPQTSQFSSPAPLTATLTENADGSATYALPLLGSSDDSEITYGAPQNGTIAIAIVPPSSSGVATANYTVASWYTGSLYSETDTDDGAQTVPTACGAASFATTANALDQRIQRIDAIAGTHEWFDQVTYVAPNDGPVCVTLFDVTYAYYDLTGQGNEAPYGLTFSGGSSPIQIDTTITTLGLSDETLQARARTAAQAERATLHLAAARQAFLDAIEFRRTERLRSALARLRAGLAKRMHR